MLVILFLFSMGSMIGWVIEFFFRRFFSPNNPNRKWINPGFLMGPWLPLYGTGLVILCSIASIRITALDDHPVIQSIVTVLIMTAAMTVIEYIAGLIFIKGMNIKLWDYSDRPGNIQGIICPLFTFFWGVVAAIYYFFIHPHIINSLIWLAGHLTFSFFIGFFYGIFVIDLVNSFKIMTKVKKFADDYNIVVRIEELKAHIATAIDEEKEKRRFLHPLHSLNTLSTAFEKNSENFSIQKKIKKVAKKLKDDIQ